ncbi:ComEA family DNA-binding protein [Alicyclobacillus sendaiensis]|uniref:ComEA family DNA-binding protein n=1 Tax=Alicyclobacillus sendaiensis TaxID=192387 RepID=UPI0026F4506F|nr:ComEA family DNA-binding protein [Alicyclobacillus sendaiensis]
MVNSLREALGAQGVEDRVQPEPKVLASDEDAEWDEVAWGEGPPGWSGGRPEAEAMGHGEGRKRLIGRLRAWARYLRIALLIGVAAGAAWFASRQVATSSEAHSTSAGSGTARSAVQMTDVSGADATTLQVDVHGDVRHPGLVTLQEGARVRDAIRAAGGFLHDADAANVNQAALVWDGEEIDVPGPSADALSQAQSGVEAARRAPAETSAAHGEGGTAQGGAGDRARKRALSAGEKININTADLETLETLPGVGPKRAEAILAYREAHGPFPDLESLRHVKGIGEKTLAKWKDLITFGAPGGSSGAGRPSP